MIYLDLFLGFLKVGCFAFGGAYGAIPLIRDVVLDYGWLDEEAEKGFPGAMPEKATVTRTLGKYILAFGGSAYVLPREQYRTRVRYTPHVFSDGELAALFDEIDKADAEFEAFLLELLIHRFLSLLCIAVAGGHCGQDSHT